MDPLHSACTPYPPDSPDDFWPFPDAWRTEAVLGLAFGIRAEEAFDRMPILADALEEAGCDDMLILNHCRDCAEHGVDCWVIECIVPSDQDLWSDVIWRVKDLPAPPPNEWAAESPRQVLINRVADTTQRGCLLVVSLIAAGAILVAVIQSMWWAWFG